jgi:hypothetical protein
MAGINLPRIAGPRKPSQVLVGLSPSRNPAAVTNQSQPGPRPSLAAISRGGDLVGKPSEMGPIVDGADTAPGAG